MQLLLVVVGSVLVCSGVALFSALKIALDARAMGQANGLWALACGLELGPVQLAGVLAKGTPARLDVTVFGRRFALRRFWPRRGSRNAEKRAPAEKIEKKAKGLPAWLDPLDAALFALDERRHLRIESLDIDVDYGFQDVALTGKLAGALYMLSAVVPRRVRIKHTPSWQGAETWQLHVEGRFAVWPGLVLAEVLWYIIRARLRRRPVRPSVEPVPGTAA